MSPLGLSTVPQSCEREQLPFIDFKTIRLLGFPVPPFIETVCGDQAPAEFQRITKCGLGACRFRPCVDHLAGDRRVLRPRGNESPPHQRQFPDGFSSDSGGSPGQAVWAQCCIGESTPLPRTPVEVLLDDLFSPRKPIAPAHGEIMADRRELFRRCPAPARWL